jgi:hypothetical protein
MKYHKIEYHAQQLAKTAAELGVDPSKDPDLITRPPLMREIHFQTKLARFKKHQKLTADLARRGLEKWFIRNYSR